MQQISTKPSLDAAFAALSDASRREIIRTLLTKSNSPAFNVA